MTPPTARANRWQQQQTSKPRLSNTNPKEANVTMLLQSRLRAIIPRDFQTRKLVPQHPLPVQAGNTRRVRAAAALRGEFMNGLVTQTQPNYPITRASAKSPKPPRAAAAVAVPTIPE